MNNIFNKIYSKKTYGNKTRYQVFGIKISCKNKNATKKINLNLLKKDIIKAISSPKTEYVSFDIFDTLLVRPCIKPTDIFAIIAEKVDNKYNINFISMRASAEQELNKNNANIYDIYDFIKEKYKLTEELKSKLIEEEIAAETQLLGARKDLKEIYDIAIANNKKIVAISDMYLPSKVLENILPKKGFNNISKVYVSNEYGQRKDCGELFDTVISDLKTKKIVHIGDNYSSDYEIPKTKGLVSFFYPKVIDILANFNPLFKKLIKSSSENSIENYNRNVFIGFVLNNFWFNYDKSNENGEILYSLKDFANLFLAPYLFYIINCLQKNILIQNTYKSIYFVARDGYLPNKIYNILNDGKYIPSKYVYGSRVAYWVGTHSSIYHLLKSEYKKMTKDYTLKDFINAYISDKNIYSYLINKYTENELSTRIKDNFSFCINLLYKENKTFEEYYNNQSQLAKEYYNNVFSPDEKRILVFDVGYSGSISLGLSKLTKLAIDKIYIHETEKNILRDNQNKTYTFILKNGIYSNKYENLDLLLEECFSPLEGTCKGFAKGNNKVIPVLEEMTVSKEMGISNKNMVDASEEFAKETIREFGDYLQYLNIIDINPLFNLINTNFIKNKKSKSIFKDIVYNDTATRHSQKTLAKKIRAKV